MADWKRQTLDAHNDFRREHGSAALQWSDECYQSAKKQADACQAKGCMFHGTTSGPSGRHGQNIYWCSAPGSSAKKMVKAWYDEIAAYDFGGDYQKGTGNVIGRFKENVLPHGSPYVPEKAEDPSQGSCRSVTEVIRGADLRHDHHGPKVKLPQRRPSYSGGSKSGPEARFPDEMSKFFKDLEFPSTRRSSGYSEGHSTVTRKAGYQRETGLPTQFQSSSSSCGGTRSTTTVTKTVASNGTVVTKTTRTVYSWS
ncbi:unnamed protein product [Cladocopium goreaui]|uniref:Golgi-associated plant pathogenesis-related protein 1 n=1 Tax=Cladocopium goreaui TaxID=2562237 RepID=A0A9P1GAE9_9DINO|nr:unnamed protein product [Cladocopium goreaui]